MAQRQGRTFHGFRAACGHPIVSLGQLAIGSTISVGPEPHTQCAKCFAQDEQHEDVALPDDPLAAPVYDEHGTPIPAQRDERMGTPHKGPLGPVVQGNGLGQYENRPYG